MTVKAILFDHDGTLVDSEATHFQLWKTILAHYQIQLAEDGYKQFHSGIPTARNAEILVEKYQINSTPQELAKQKDILTNAFFATQCFPLMPGVKDTLQTFYDVGLTLGIVTGAGRIGVDTTLAGHQLSDFFSVITTGEDVRLSKPDPAVYTLAMDKLGVSAQECIAIEDTENGIRSAVEAGLPCLAVKNAYSASHDFSQATFIFDSMIEAKNWVINHSF